MQVTLPNPAKKKSPLGVDLPRVRVVPKPVLTGLVLGVVGLHGAGIIIDPYLQVLSLQGCSMQFLQKVRHTYEGGGRQLITRTEDNIQPHGKKGLIE